MLVENFFFFFKVQKITTVTYRVNGYFLKETKQYHIMTGDSPSRDTFEAPSLPTKSDHDDLVQNTDDHNTLDINFNVSALLLSEV